MKHVFAALGVAATIVGFAACAGTDGSMPRAPLLSAEHTPGNVMRTTVAWGTVVSDPDGTALVGVPVRLYRWKPCPLAHKAFHCPPPILTTATASGGRFRFTAPNGHYLLVIGSNSARDFDRATVHDSVRLRGGTQHLLAPVLPTPSPIPGVTFWRVRLPQDQLHGQYRLTKIEATREAPCLRDIDAERRAHHLGALVTDEWLTENERTLLQEYRHTHAEAPILLAESDWHGLRGPCTAPVRMRSRTSPSGVAPSMDFSLLPPEVNSALMYAGAGAAPMSDAASAWEGLAGDLASLTNAPPGGNVTTWP